MGSRITEEMQLGLEMPPGAERKGGKPPGFSPVYALHVPRCLPLAGPGQNPVDKGVQEMLARMAMRFRIEQEKGGNGSESSRQIPGTKP